MPNNDAGRDGTWFNWADLMRCDQCGWVMDLEGDPCGRSTRQRGDEMLTFGTRVIARAGKGAVLPDRWFSGEVAGHKGPIYQVATPAGDFWCEEEDLFPESYQRDADLVAHTRVLALWQDGRFYPGQIDRCEDSLRHIQFDDGDSMWVEAFHCALLAREADAPGPDTIVLALHRGGRLLPATVLEQQGGRFKVSFLFDGEEGWVSREGIVVYPPNPFQ